MFRFCASNVASQSFDHTSSDISKKNIEMLFRNSDLDFQTQSAAFYVERMDWDATTTAKIA